MEKVNHEPSITDNLEAENKQILFNAIDELKAIYEPFARLYKDFFDPELKNLIYRSLTEEEIDTLENLIKPYIILAQHLTVLAPLSQNTDKTTTENFTQIIHILYDMVCTSTMFKKFIEQVIVTNANKAKQVDFLTKLRERLGNLNFLDIIEQTAAYKKLLGIKYLGNILLNLDKDDEISKKSLTEYKQQFPSLAYGTNNILTVVQYLENVFYTPFQRALKYAGLAKEISKELQKNHEDELKKISSTDAKHAMKAKLAQGVKGYYNNAQNELGLIIINLDRYGEDLNKAQEAAYRYQDNYRSNNIMQTSAETNTDYLLLVVNTFILYYFCINKEFLKHCKVIIQDVTKENFTVDEINIINTLFEKVANIYILNPPSANFRLAQLLNELAYENIFLRKTKVNNLYKILKNISLEPDYYKDVTTLSDNIFFAKSKSTAQELSEFRKQLDNFIQKSIINYIIEKLPQVSSYSKNKQFPEPVKGFKVVPAIFMPSQLTLDRCIADFIRVGLHNILNNSLNERKNEISQLYSFSAKNIRTLMINEIQKKIYCVGWLLITDKKILQPVIDCLNKLGSDNFHTANTELELFSRHRTILDYESLSNEKSFKAKPYVLALYNFIRLIMFTLRSISPLGQAVALKLEEGNEIKNVKDSKPKILAEEDVKQLQALVREALKIFIKIEEQAQQEIKKNDLATLQTCIKSLALCKDNSIKKLIQPLLILIDQAELSLDYLQEINFKIIKNIKDERVHHFMHLAILELVCWPVHEYLKSTNARTFIKTVDEKIELACELVNIFTSLAFKKIDDRIDTIKNLTEYEKNLCGLLERYVSNQLVNHIGNVNSIYNPGSEFEQAINAIYAFLFEVNPINKGNPFLQARINALAKK